MSGVMQREFGKQYDTTPEFKQETLLAYVRKLDRHALALSGMAVVMASAEARRLLMAGPTPSESRAGNQDGGRVDGGVIFSAETEWGPVVVGGTGDNVYHKDCCIIIDLGGNDRYMNRAGGAVGVLSKPFSVLIDLAGNDYYSSDRMYSQGAALVRHGRAD